MVQLNEILERLGDLHDARMSCIAWDSRLMSLEFKFDDIYANFKGLSNYPGPQSGSIQLHQVSEVAFDFDASEEVYIYDFSVVELQGEWLATVLLRPSGKITAKFKSAVGPDDAGSPPAERA
jgi:hypothetical protein